MECYLLGEFTVLSVLLHAQFSSLVKVDAEHVAELALEVELLKGDRGLISRRVADCGLAKAHLLADAIEARLELAARDCAVLATDLLQLVLRQLFKSDQVSTSICETRSFDHHSSKVTF